MEQRQRKTGMSEFFVDSWGHPAERVSYFLSDWDERLWCNPWQDGVIPRCDVIFGYRGVFRGLGDCRGARVFWDAEEILRGPRCYRGPRCFRGAINVAPAADNSHPFCRRAGIPLLPGFLDLAPGIPKGDCPIENQLPPAAVRIDTEIA